MSARSLIPTILWGLVPLLALAQDTGTSRLVAETEDYRIEEFILPGGIESNQVHCIVQGPNGYLWFASYAGLIRYDGHEFITYFQPNPDTSKNHARLTYPMLQQLYWDSRNKLWVCSYGGGLFCFDPETEQFNNYRHDPGNPRSISNNFVTTVTEDSIGNIWVGTESGLNRLNRETGQFQRYFHDPNKKGSLSLDIVGRVFVDRNGILWVGCGGVIWRSEEGAGLNRYHADTDSFTSYLYDPRDTTSFWAPGIKGLLEDSRGNFWVGSRNGLLRFDRKTERFERMHAHPNRPHSPGMGSSKRHAVWSLMEDSRGGLWIGIFSTDPDPPYLLRYDPHEEQVFYFPFSLNPNTVCESRDGSIWIADEQFEKKVLKISPKEQSYQLLKGEHLFDQFKNSSVYRELNSRSSDGHWLGPYSLTFDPKDGMMWLEYAYQTQKDQQVFSYPILARHQSQTNETQFFYLEALNTIQLNHTPEDTDNDGSHWWTSGMAVDHSGRIWGSYPSPDVGLYCFDPKKDTTIHYLHAPQDTNSIMSNTLVALMMDKQENIWVAQKDTGFSKLHTESGRWRHYSMETVHAVPQHVGMSYGIIEKEDGTIWMAGSTNGMGFIAGLNPADTMNQSFSQIWSNKWRTRPLMSVKRDTLVFAFNSVIPQQRELGLLFPDHPTEPVFLDELSKEIFAIDNEIGSMVLDESGKLWITPYFKKGVFLCVDIDKKRLYTIPSGIDGLAYSRNGLLGPDGHVYFPIINKGWAEIDPDVITPMVSDSLELKLTDLYVNGLRQVPGSEGPLSNPIWMQEKLHLSHQIQEIELRFSHFRFREPIARFQYRLWPLEQEWHKRQGDPLITYSHIPPGTYRLQVKASTLSGRSGRNGNMLTLIIHPPWWKTGWAYSLYVLTALSLLTGLFLYQRHRYQAQARLQLERERAERLREMDRFKSRFYTNITHEFRTPLTVIKGMAGQVEGHEKIKTIIRRNSDQLLNMVNQLLDLSRLESNSLPIQWVQADIIPFLQYLTESCHSLAEKKKLSLAFFSKEDYLVMDYDELRMQQILLNLLSNAIKYTPEYGSVKVIAARVIKEKQDFLKLTVSDTGKGIPSDKLPHIFDRFYQVDDSDVRYGEGSGIGLALVKELVERFHGTIEVETEAGKGSRFMVYLPIQQRAARKEGAYPAVDPAATPTDAGLVTEKATAPLPAEGKKPEVLIIEDNTDVTEYIISCLTPAYAPQTAREGRVGVEKALEHIPDVILCDVMMPEMDGFEVCRKLKSDRRTSHIPIILLTAKATQEDKVTGLTAGADAYLTKPFDREELLIRLQNLSALSRRLQERLSGSPAPHDIQDEKERREAAFLREVNQIIRDNLSNEQFDTRRLCRAIAMSRTQLHRKLKALTGCSTASYIRSIRLQQAKTLLERSDLSIGDIAMQVGYKDFSHFSRSFAKEFGISPSETRK